MHRVAGFRLETLGLRGRWGLAGACGTVVEALDALHRVLAAGGTQDVQLRRQGGDVVFRAHLGWPRERPRTAAGAPDLVPGGT
jgi:hypothetical protein